MGGFTLIYLSQFEKIEENKFKVGFVHYAPFHAVHGLNKSREELEQEGIFITVMPQAETKEGFGAVLYTDKEQVWYECESTATPEENKVSQLESDMLDLKLAMAELVEGGVA